jgi:protein SCO1/2
MITRLLARFLLLMLLGAAYGLHAATPLEVRQRVGLDEHIGTTLPLSVTLRDERGRAVRLGELFGRKPAILALVYYDCPNLCNLTLTSLVTSLRSLDLRVGRDFEVIAVSIDPRETGIQATTKRDALVRQYGQPANSSCRDCNSGWHLLTGQSAQIAALAKAVGFRFFWDATQSQFAHPAGITVVTPAGRIARYFGGVQFPPPELRWALLQAGRQQVASSADRLWLLCYHYEALIGKYSSLVMTSVRVVGVAVVLALAALILRLARRRA